MIKEILLKEKIHNDKIILKVDSLLDFINKKIDVKTNIFDSAKEEIFKKYVNINAKNIINNVFEKQISKSCEKITKRNEILDLNTNKQKKMHSKSFCSNFACKNNKTLDFYLNSKSISFHCHKTLFSEKINYEKNSENIICCTETPKKIEKKIIYDEFSLKKQKICNIILEVNKKYELLYRYKTPKRKKNILKKSNVKITKPTLFK